MVINGNVEIGAPSLDLSAQGWAWGGWTVGRWSELCGWCRPEVSVVQLGPLGSWCALHAARRSGQEGSGQAGTGVYPGTPVTAGTARTRLCTRYSKAYRQALYVKRIAHGIFSTPAPNTVLHGDGSTSPRRRHLAPLCSSAQQPQSIRPSKSGARGQQCPGDGGDGDDGARR